MKHYGKSSFLLLMALATLHVSPAHAVLPSIIEAPPELLIEQEPVANAPKPVMESAPDTIKSVETQLWESNESAIDSTHTPEDAPLFEEQLQDMSEDLNASKPDASTPPANLNINSLYEKLKSNPAPDVTKNPTTNPAETIPVAQKANIEGQKSQKSEKAQKIAEKEAAEKEAAKKEVAKKEAAEKAQSEEAQKQAEKAAKLAKKEAEKAARLAEKQARQEAEALKKAQKEAQKIAEKKAEEAAKAAEEQAPDTPPADVPEPEGEGSDTMLTAMTDTTPSRAVSDDLIQEMTDNLGEDPTPEDVMNTLPESLRKELETLTKALHREHQAIFNELRDDEELALNDIAMLWQAAVERSGSIRFAIEKLSRRDATGQPLNQVSFTERLLRNVVRIGGVAGSIWTGTPAGVLGGSLVEDLVSGDPSESIMSRVTDADMLILAKEVEALQTQVIESYYHYRHTQEQWKLAKESKRNLAKFYVEQYESEDAQAEALQPVLDALYDGMLLEEHNCHQSYVSARNHLGLLVGGEALIALEQTRRESALK